MKATIDAYIWGRNRKLFMVALMLFSVLPLFGQQSTGSQDVHKRDTLLYCWHDSWSDGYPDMIPEDSYMELYLEDGILKKGFFWGTTDEFETGREGYECGYFVLPLTDIRHEKDSVSFRLSLIKTEHGEAVNSFVMAPVNLHIRSWRQALSCYQAWQYFSGSLDDNVRFSISLNRWPEDGYTLFPMGDSAVVRNLTNPYSVSLEGKKVFVLQRGMP